MATDVAVLVIGALHLALRGGKESSTPRDDIVLAFAPTVRCIVKDMAYICGSHEDKLEDACAEFNS